MHLLMCSQCLTTTTGIQSEQATLTAIHLLHGLFSLNPGIARAGKQSLSIWLYHSSLFIPVTNVCNFETKIADV